MIRVQIPFQGLYETELSELPQLEVDFLQEDLPEGIEIQASDYVSWCKTYHALAQEYALLWLAKKGYTGKFVKMVSPREYNFSTDILWVDIPEKELEPLRAYKYDEEFADWVADNYTSRPGFISFVEPDVTLWDDKFGDTEYALVFQYLEQDRELEEEILEELRGNNMGLCLFMDYDGFYSAIAEEALELADAAKKADAKRKELVNYLAEQMGHETTEIGRYFKLTKRVTKTTAYKAAVEKYAPDADLTEFQKESTSFLLRRIK